MKKRVIAFLLTLIMLLGMLPMSVFAVNYSSVPLKLTVNSYGAPFLSGSTGAHTVYSFDVTNYIKRADVGSDNADGSATARFVGSNETGWQLYIDVEIGNYKASWPQNARITNKDMSEATGSITFGLSFNSSGGTSTTLRISGGKDLPKPEVTYTLAYDKNTQDAVTNMPNPNPQTAKNSTGKVTFFVSETVPVREGYEFKGWQTSDGAQVGPQVTLTKDHPSMTLYAVWAEHVHHDEDKDGYCDDDHACMHPKDDNGNCTIDGCTHPDSCCPKPEQPEIPPIPGKDENTIGGSGFNFTCVTEEAAHNRTLQVTLRNHPDAFTVGTEVKQKEDPRGKLRAYFEVTVTDVAAYLPDYNYFYGNHKICDGEPETLTLTFWLLDSGSWGQWNAEEVKVECVKTPDAPTAEEVRKALGNVTVKCLNPTTGENDCTDISYWAAGGNSVGAAVKVTDTQYTVAIGADAFVNAYAKGKGAHDRYSAETLTWVLNYKDGKWTGTPETAGVDDTILVTHAPQKWKEVGKMGKDAEGNSTGIKATCTTGSYGPITYGLTTAFVYYDTDVVSVEYQGEGRYLATFKTDKYVKDIGKGCNDHFEAARNHKFTSGNETVQWYLSVGVQDETTGKYSWYAEPVTAGTDDVLTVVHDWTITFDPANGEPSFTQNVFDGETAVEPDVPEKQGYTFDGWYLNDTDAFRFDAPVTGDLTLTAHWTLIPPTADSEPKFTGLKIKVDCTDNKSGHPQGAYTYGLIYGLDNTDGFTKNGWTEEDGAYYYTVTINKAFYIGRYANTTRTAHTEDGEAGTEVRWQWTGTDWQLMTETDSKDIVLTIFVKCEEKQIVNVVIYRNGDFKNAYKTVSLDPQPKGTVIDLSELNIADYYTGKCEFHGWFNDGAWNEYQQNPDRAGEKTITVNGWTNIICMVYDYETVVYFDSLESLTAYQEDHTRDEGLLFTTEALHGTALPTVDAPAAVRDGYTFTHWSREGQTTDVTGQTVGGWTNLYANWEVTPHNIYAYARLNSAFASLTPDEFKDTLTLNAETLKRLGLGGYNANGFISIGTFRFDRMALTEAVYGAAWDDAEFRAAIEALADSIVLETGVSADTAEQIVWTALYQAGEDSGMEAGYPTADESGYQLTGNLNLAAVMFQPNGENVTGMPAVNYPCGDVFEIHDFYLPGQSITMPADPARAGYDFLGWSVQVIPGEEDVEIQALPGDGSLLKSGAAYTVTDGGVIFTAQWKARDDTPYMVEHYQEQLDGTYKLADTDALKGTTDTEAVAAAKSYDDFTVDKTVEGTAASGTIAGDGSLVLKLYYTRNTYNYEVRHIKQLPDGSYDTANAEVETLSGKFEALAAVNAKDYGTHYPSNDAAEKQNIQIVKGLVIEVRYDLDAHTLTFETGAGASAIDPVTVRHGNAAAKPADPSKDGWKFLGWYEDAACTKDYDISAVLTEDKTVYAGWTKAEPAVVTNRLTIRYIYSDGTMAAGSRMLDLVLGAAYSVTSPVLSGWRADLPVVQGTMPGYDFTVTVTYTRTSGVPAVLPTRPTAAKTLKFNTSDHFAYVNGYPNGTVKPTGNVTRAEVAAILYRIMDKTCVELYETAESSFADVSRSSWYSTYVATLETAGVIVDTPAGGSFRPNEAITRAELASMLAQFAAADASNAAAFQDVASSHWASAEIAIASKMGWINGYPDGTFRPDQTITRAEMMAMVNRALARTPESENDLLPGMKTWSDNADTGAWYYLDVQEATNSHTYTKSGSRETWNALR